MYKKTERVDIVISKEEFEQMIREKYDLEGAGEMHFKFVLKLAKGGAFNTLLGNTEDNLDKVKVWTIKESQ